GAVAEHSDTRRLMVMAHLGAVVPPLFVAWLVASGTLTFVPLILAGLFMGTVSAFMLPAREAMLARVLGTNEGAAIQRAVRFSLLAQFLAQVAGMAFARLADKTGLEVMLLIQAGLQLAGAAAAFMLLPAPSLLTNSAAGLRGQWVRIREGLEQVRNSPSLLPITVLTFAIGVFFVGSFMVVLPIILRDDPNLGATVERVSSLQVSFWSGTILSTLAVGAFGEIARKGRLIVCAVGVGCVVLLGLSVPGPLWLFYALSFVWGLGAGVTLTMTRTIVQLDAPPTSRARVLSVYQMGFSGGLPLGSLLAGPIVEAVGGRGATVTAALGMAFVVAVLVLRTKLWNLSHAPSLAASKP
ncbi:MAG TPA: hypothetical protein DCL54_10805, partial [Alphaproteobacteria bacterium]|nr:hypothetical protein [Alphaproteobacteria bacterium]